MRSCHELALKTEPIFKSSEQSRVDQSWGCCPSLWGGCCSAEHLLTQNSVRAAYGQESSAYDQPARRVRITIFLRAPGRAVWLLAISSNQDSLKGGSALLFNKK